MYLLLDQNRFFFKRAAFGCSTGGYLSLTQCLPIARDTLHRYSSEYPLLLKHAFASRAY
jgi:hypothetical protein